MKKQQFEPESHKSLTEKEINQLLTYLLNNQEKEFIEEYKKLPSYERKYILSIIKSNYGGVIPKKLLFKMLETNDKNLKIEAWDILNSQGISLQELFWIIANVPELNSHAWGKFDRTYGNLIKSLKEMLERIKKFTNLNYENYEESLNQKKETIKNALNASSIDENKKREILEKIEKEYFKSI